MKTFAELDQFILSGGRRADGYRAVASIRNTIVQRRGPFDAGVIGVFYHGTCVVEAHQDDTFVLNTNGYRTVTTKARINAFSPARVCQRKGVWWVYWFETERGEDRELQEVKFYDGIRVDSRGVPVEATR